MPAPETPHIVKSNALIEASYRLNLREQRIILACIAQVDRSQPISDEHQYSVSARDFADLTDHRIEGAYQELRLAADSLFERRLTVFEHPNTGCPRKLTMRWIQSVEYIEREGRVAIRFGKDILPYLTELTRRFTKYALSDVAKMSSPHAIRLYELLMQWRDTGAREVSIEWMRQRLGLEDKYPAYKDLRRWVIDPAVKQINEHSPIRVKWEARKTGRKVTHIAFRFTIKRKAKSPEQGGKAGQEQGGKPKGNDNGASREPSIRGIPKSLIEQRANPGESYDDCALRLLDERQRAKRARGG